MRAAVALVALVSLSACMQAGTPGANVVQDGARAVARQSVNSAVAAKLPGVDASPVTDCIIDNATLDELVTIARSATLSANPVGDVWPVVQTVAGRRATLECFSESLSMLQLAGLAGGLR